MTISPLAFAESLHIGIVDFVSPDEIKVLLDIEAPDSMAMNTGTPRPFPRINSYVLIPGDQGYLVGQVEWITIERSQYPKRKGMQDFGLVDLPYPLRKMSLNPLGSLNYDDKEGDDQGYTFKRGVESYPAVGDAVLLPTQNQLRAIIESGEKRRVKIGISPTAANAEVKIDPDRLFGRHLAVLGNTGSGKSCSVAGLIRWSLEEARKTRNGADPNARFVILDPNGEYANTFRDMGKVRVFAVDPGKDTNINQLQVPLWFWNSAEWSAFTRASDKAQRPLLRRALREIRIGSGIEKDNRLVLRRKISSILITLQAQVRNGANYEGWKFGPKLPAFITDLDEYSRQFPDQSVGLIYLRDKVKEMLGKYLKIKNGQPIGYNDFSATDVDTILALFNRYLGSIGGIVYQTGPNEDAPLPFDGAQFADHMESLAHQENNSQYFDYLIMRIRTMLADTRINRIATGMDSISLQDWLENYIGTGKGSDGTVTVIDLSLMPAEVVHIITSVIARMVLESLQRYRRLNSSILPTVLVMEEAHTFIKHYTDNAEDQNSVAVCCQVFEKIAREGRKFGLGLVLSSQRPSELSPTVLSQCNTFLLHRISNDRDQELISKLVPDNLRGILRDLPTLPSRHAILLGWASELPVLVQMNALPESQRPQSDDPDFWAVWSGEGLKTDSQKKPVERTVDWKKIADDWQQTSIEKQ
jgi:DNA helicase HerA-like ATPase